MFQGFSLLRAVIQLPGILLGFTFHEYAHAYMATKFGDPTPGRQGRLTANPLAHIDLWGLLLIIFSGFGWAKPVQTNPSNYRGDVRRKDLIVSFAGPFVNLLIAIIAAVIYIVVVRFGLLNNIERSAAQIVINIIYEAVWINCVLFIFNLIPIPPLDGFHILSDLVPQSSYRLIYTMEKYGYIILLVFVLTPFSDLVIGRGAHAVFKAIFTILGVS